MNTKKMNKTTAYKTRLLQSATREIQISKVNKGVCKPSADTIAVEEPLEIKLGYGSKHKREQRSISITMRTPGNDFDLARGFLFTEGIIASEKDILNIRFVGKQLDSDTRDNIVLVDIHPEVEIEINKLSRHFYTSSSCGVCGKASIELVQITTCFYPQPKHPLIHQKQVLTLSGKLMAAQSVFVQTGGIHAAGLFDQNGNLLMLREDVGRHNALDKLIGVAMQQKGIPLRDFMVVVSGRASFELVQKAAMCGLPILAAVGAPSSLAIELADSHGMTLVGFLKEEKFNIYCGRERIVSC